MRSPTILNVNNKIIEGIMNGYVDRWYLGMKWHIHKNLGIDPPPPLPRKMKINRTKDTVAFTFPIECYSLFCKKINKKVNKIGTPTGKKIENNNGQYTYTFTFS